MADQRSPANVTRAVTRSSSACRHHRSVSIRMTLTLGRLYQRAPQRTERISLATPANPVFMQAAGHGWENPIASSDPAAGSDRPGSSRGKGR